MAWSVFRGVAAVLLIALWVRSYWCYEIVSGRSYPHDITLGATRGVMFLNYGQASPDTREIVNDGWEYNPHAPSALAKPFAFSASRKHLLIITPIWLALVVVSMPAVAPLAVYAARK